MFGFYVIELNERLFFNRKCIKWFVYKTFVNIKRNCLNILSDCHQY